MEEHITRAEHDEFCKRLDAHNRRQDSRLERVENDVRDTLALTTSVERLAVSVEAMVKEQDSQGKRLTVLESRDGEKWRKVMGYIVTAIVSVVIGVIVTRLGIQ